MFAKSAGREKVRLSCIFTAAADETKLLILRVLPRVKEIPSLNLGPNIIYIYVTKGTFNSENLTHHYVKRILRPYLEINMIEKPVIILDQARCHMTNQFVNALEARNAEIVFLPASLTSVLQPADVGWFKPLKEAYKVHWNYWFMNEPKSFTRFGNIA